MFFFFNYFYFSGFVLGLHSCMQAFSSCREWVLLSNCDAWVSHHSGFCCCGAQAQQLWHMGLVAPCHLGSSQTRDQTDVPCIESGFLATGPPGKPLYLFTRNSRPHPTLSLLISLSEFKTYKSPRDLVKAQMLQ